MALSRKKTSNVWKHFCISDEDLNKAICKSCGVAISRGNSYGTTSLAAHLKKHKGMNLELDKEARKRLEQMYRRSMPRANRSSINDDSGGIDGQRDIDKNGNRRRMGRPKSEKVQTQTVKRAHKRNMSSVSEEYLAPEQDYGFLKNIISLKRMDLVHSAFLMNVLYQQHECGKFCDMKLVSGPDYEDDSFRGEDIGRSNVTLDVHSSILAALSGKVKMLVETGTRTIELKEASPYGVKSLMEIVYTGKLRRALAPLSYHDVKQIWKAASDLEIDYAKNYIIQEHPQISRQIQEEENAVVVEDAARFTEVESQDQDGESNNDEISAH